MTTQPTTVLVKQRREYDCVLACLCMATGKEYARTWDLAFQELVESQCGCSGDTFRGALNMSGLVKGLDYVEMSAHSVTPQILRKLLWGRRALIQVPSLNGEGLMHYVYYDGLSVYDPSNKQRYQWLSQLSPEWIILLKH